MKQGQTPGERREGEPDGGPDGDLDRIDRESADSFPSSDPPATSNPGDGREEGWQEERQEERQEEPQEGSQT